MIESEEASMHSVLGVRGMRQSRNILAKAVLRRSVIIIREVML